MGYASYAAMARGLGPVRLVLVPAVMELFGQANWWLPGWLARLLPQGPGPVSEARPPLRLRFTEAPNGPGSRACMVREPGDSKGTAWQATLGTPRSSCAACTGRTSRSSGCRACELGALDGYDVVVPRRALRQRHVVPVGPRFGPQAIRITDYLPHDGSRPHLALRRGPAGRTARRQRRDVVMPPGETEKSLQRLEDAVHAVAAAGAIPVILGGDHTVTLPDATGVARHVGWGRVSLIHFDAHADTGDTQFGSLYGHGTPMRRLIESGAVRGDRFLQIGLRGYWPEPPMLAWMAEQRMRSFEMSEISSAGLDECLTEALAIAADDCDGVFLSVDVDVVDPGMAPGTGTPEPGGLTGRAAPRRGAPDRDDGAAGRDRRGGGRAAVRPRRGDRVPGQPGGARGAVRHRLAAAEGGRAPGRQPERRCSRTVRPNLVGLVQIPHSGRTDRHDL